MEAPPYFFKVFTDEAKSGNPAACALFSQWPDSKVLQHIAREADQVVTAFIVPAADSPYQYHIRWFSRTQEINLCGHGTLAAAALVRQLKGEGSYSFLSEYGELTVQANTQYLQMSLPQWPSDGETPVELPKALWACQPVDYFQSRDLGLIRQLSQHALIITAFCVPDTYVLRYFAPAIGIDEDIATGSAQCSLAPYWTTKTGLAELKVRQLSAIPASFSVAIKGQQLHLKTQAVYLPHLTRVKATIA